MLSLCLLSHAAKEGGPCRWAQTPGHQNNYKAAAMVQTFGYSEAYPPSSRFSAGHFFGIMECSVISCHLCIRSIVTLSVRTITLHTPGPSSVPGWLGRATVPGRIVESPYSGNLRSDHSNGSAINSPGTFWINAIQHRLARTPIITSISVFLTASVASWKS